MTVGVRLREGWLCDPGSLWTRR